MPVKVSVLLAACNGERYIDEAIRSVLSQTGVPFELLIGDDASSDGSWERIRSFQGDPHVCAWRFKTRLGTGGNRRRLTRRARGRYLSICDQDDRMLPGNLRALAQALDRYPGAGVAYAPILAADEKGAVRPYPYRFTGPDAGWDLIGPVTPHPGSMLRRKWVERVGGYDPRLALGLDDYDLFLRLAEVSEFRQVGNRPLMLHRLHPGALTFSKSLAKARDRSMREVLRKAIFRRYGARVRW